MSNYWWHRPLFEQKYIPDAHLARVIHKEHLARPGLDESGVGNPAWPRGCIRPGPGPNFRQKLMPRNGKTPGIARSTEKQSARAGKCTARS